MMTINETLGHNYHSAWDHNAYMYMCYSHVAHNKHVNLNKINVVACTTHMCKMSLVELAMYQYNIIF